jgi:hypothetical protein
MTPQALMRYETGCTAGTQMGHTISFEFDGAPAV